MRTTSLVLAGMIGLVGGYVSAQTTRQMGPLAVRDKAPSDKAIDLTQEDLIAVVKEMPAKNLATTRLLEGGFYSVNVRRLTGPETAHVHPTSLTIYVVREGSGTLITGGTIVDAKGQPVPAGKPGDDIKGGVERTDQGRRYRGHAARRAPFHARCEGSHRLHEPGLRKREVKSWGRTAGS